MNEYYEGITDFACFVLEEIEQGKSLMEIKEEMYLMSACVRKKLAEDFRCHFPTVFPLIEHPDHQALSEMLEK